MSKRFSACLLAFATSLLLGSSVLVGQLANRSPRNSAEASSALSATNQVLEQVSRLRGLPVKHPVKSGLKSKAEIEKMLMEDMKATNTPEEIEANRKVLVKFGMIAPDFPLADYQVKLLAEQIVGFYEPKTKEFYLADWVPIDDQRVTMAHELTHALQDQYFDLERLDKFPKHEGDAEMAAHSLVEGEATVLMFSWQQQMEASKLPTFRIPDESMHQGVSGERFPVFENAPLVLRENVTFPYFYGAVFVQSIVRKGSWDAITKSYSDMPISTEQIMHPEKFINRDNPIEITLPDLSSQLGPSWKQIDSDVTGEFDYKLLLEQFIDKTKAQNAAAGWGGDRYAAFENNKTGEILLTQMTMWDTENDAREFFEAYCERTQIRYQNPKQTESTPDTRRWHTSQGDVIIQLRGNSVLIVEGGNSKLQDQLVPRLWQSEHKTISSIPWQNK
ncbi:MAG TPA: hypothetical protein VFC63_23920 [Blastocatellia bacterium]|nr:hypothetical protein [Blastocatellia bacterium]